MVEALLNAVELMLCDISSLILLRGSMFYSMNFKQTGMDTLMSFPVAVSKPVALSRLKMVILSES